MKKLLFFIATLFVLGPLAAQPGCPQVSAGPDVTLPCGTNCTTLTATSLDVGSSSTYGVSQIAYNPFPYCTGSAVLVHTDDKWSPTVDLGFTFCFFGTAYTQMLVGSNGEISFNTANAGQFNSWSIPGGIPFTSPADQENTIMGVWEDIDPTHQGNQYVQLFGTAPCRIAVVTWCSCAYFGSQNSVDQTYCDLDPTATTQIVLYETTNVIEIYIQQKDTGCSSGGFGYWNNDWAIEGIQNSNGTTAYTVPGRNATIWTAANDAWRFTPNGPSIVTTSWWQGNTEISTDSVATVCPSQQTTYTAQSIYVPCSGGVPDTVTSSVTVSLTGTLVSAIDSFHNVSCFGAADGAAWASESGGTPPVTYGWSNGSNSLSINNLSPGTYIFTAQDASGCSRRDTVVISQPAQLTVTVPNVTVANCTGAGTGALTAQVNGGATPYTYSWTGGQNTQTATNISAGTYTVTVTDSSGCTASASGTLTVNIGGSTLAAGNQVVQNVTCFNAANGFIIANFTGGTPPFAYSWSNGETGDTATVLGPNTYSVTATDAGGCTATASATITQPTQLILNQPTIQNIGCNGVVTGSITANATGGTNPLTYAWIEQSNNQSLSGQTITGLSADTYNLTVTDANGCSLTASYQITQTAALAFTQASTNVTCFGGNNGSATITITSGTPPYQFNWNGTGDSTDATLSQLTAGANNVTITDASGCTATASFNITQPAQIVISLVTQTNVSCAGGSDGAITISVTGGTGNYAYLWSDGQSNPNLTNIPAGVLTITVTDVSNCTATATYTITEPTPISFNPATIQNIGCNGGSTGSITSNPTGGTPAYTYNWVAESTGNTYTGQTISNIPADTYDLTVTDANNCSATATYQVTAIPLLTFNTSFIDVSCFGGSDGIALVSVTSGTPPYLYNWSGAGTANDSTMTGIPQGSVNVTITDANNCTGTATFAIAQPTQITIVEQSHIDVLCNGTSTGSITLVVNGGTPAYNIIWSNGLSGQVVTALAAGVYTVTVTDANLCTAMQTDTIKQPTALAVNPTEIDDQCFGANDGSVSINASGGTPPYTFLWNNGQTTDVATQLAVGAYSCTVTDANSCTVSGASAINQPSQIITTAVPTAVKCIGLKDGTIAVSATGGEPPYDFSVSKDGYNFIYASNGLIIGLDTGTYNLYTSDSNGCVIIQPVTIPNAIPDNFTTTTDSTLCYGPDYNDGAAHITALTLLNGPFVYTIDDGLQQLSGDFYNLSAGPHTINATNANGCIDTIPVFIYEPLPIEADIVPDTVILELTKSQQVQVNVRNAVDQTYSWTPDLGLSCIDCPNPVVSAYSAGIYTVTISMENGVATCYGYATLYVEVGPPDPIFIPTSFTPNGDGNNDQFLVYGNTIKSVAMTIYNRWGELVYQTSNFFAGWDGSYKGQLQQPQVYTYIATVTMLDDTQITKKGTVTLIR